jgi:hypothetical protein
MSLHITYTAQHNIYVKRTSSAQNKGDYMKNKCLFCSLGNELCEIPITICEYSLEIDNNVMREAGGQFTDGWMKVTYHINNYNIVESDYYYHTKCLKEKINQYLQKDKEELNRVFGLYTLTIILLALSVVSHWLINNILPKFVFNQFIPYIIGIIGITLFTSIVSKKRNIKKLNDKEFILWYLNNNNFDYKKYYFGKIKDKIKQYGTNIYSKNMGKGYPGGPEYINSTASLENEIKEYENYR